MVGAKVVVGLVVVVLEEGAVLGTDVGGTGLVVPGAGAVLAVVLLGPLAGTGGLVGAPGGGGSVVVGKVVTVVMSWVTVAGVQLTVGPSNDQSITPWSPCAGDRGPSTIWMTSPTRLKWKKVSARAGLRLTQPCETFSTPCSEMSQGAACTYSPLSEMWTSQ